MSCEQWKCESVESYVVLGSCVEGPLEAKLERGMCAGISVVEA